MRPLGFILAATLVGIGGSVVFAQQAGGPLPPAAPPLPPAVPQMAPTLDDHLRAWEKAMADIKILRVDVTRTLTDSVFKKEKKFYGPLLLMKPNYAILRLELAGDPTKGQDYEAYLCDGKTLFQFKGLEKTTTIFPLPNAANNPGGGTDYFMLDFLSGMKAKDAKDRFEISLLKPEDHPYVYLSIAPKLGKDKQEFKALSMALYGPRTQFPYLPCKALKFNPNDDTETWDFANPQINIPNIGEKDFRYQKVPGFREVQAPPQQQPMRPGQQQMLPGGNGLPAGPGTVRP